LVRVVAAGGDRFKLCDGSQVVIRPIAAEDGDRLREGFARLSERSRYLRFQGPMPELSRRHLIYLTDVDHHDHEALIALSSAGEAVAVARFVRIDPEVAEPAIAVADDWQGRGLGTELFDRLVDRAREEGVRRFSALVLAENAEALRLLDRLGAPAQRPVGPQLELEVELPGRAREDDRLRELLRAAAAGAVVPTVSMWRMVADFAYHRRARVAADPANAIVVDVNPEPGARGGPATRIGGGLAQARGAHVHLVSAYWPLLTDRDTACERLDAAATALRSDGLEVTVHLRTGEAADAVIDVAEEHEAALIVVEPRADGGLMPWRVSSVTDRICARAPCDVLIAR
jgi:RimJ/RimL family protein N-acetyltransferase